MLFSRKITLNRSVLMKIVISYNLCQCYVQLIWPNIILQYHIIVTQLLEIFIPSRFKLSVGSVKIIYRLIHSTQNAYSSEIINVFENIFSTRFQVVNVFIRTVYFYAYYILYLQFLSFNFIFKNGKFFWVFEYFDTRKLNLGKV